MVHTGMAMGSRASASVSHQRPSDLFEARPVRETIGAGTLASGSLAIGLAGGGIEVVARLTRNAIGGRLTPIETIQNWHWPWMVPLAWAIIVGTGGLALLLIARLVPRLVDWVVPRAWIALLVVAFLLPQQELHPSASFLLAAGVAVFLRRGRSIEPIRLKQWSAVSLPVLIGLELGLVAMYGGWIWSKESRALAALPAARTHAPNVLFIVMDTVRAKNLSLHGYPRDTMPNLRRLAARGAVFHEARSPANWTLPSHASMFTGRWPHELSVSIDTGLDETFPTLAEEFSHRGYLTAGFVGNVGYANAWFGLDRGFAHYADHWNNREVLPSEVLRSSIFGSLVSDLLAAAGVRGTHQPRHTKYAHVVNQQALAWLDTQRARGNGQPFFLFLNYIDAHGPYRLPLGMKAAFVDDEQRLAQLEQSQRSFRGSGARPDNSLSELSAAPEVDHRKADELAELNTEVGHERQDHYDSCLQSLDEKIGQLLEQLELRDELDSTLVVITSDHGEHFGEHGYFHHGMSLYRELIHVPLILVGPRVPEGVSVGEPVSTRCLPATICSLVRIDDHPFPGGSLSSAWAAPPRQVEPVLCEVECVRRVAPRAEFPPSLGPMWAVIDKELTYIYRGDGREEVFELPSDLNEERNLARCSSLQQVVNRARSQLVALQSAAGPRYKPRLVSDGKQK